MTVSTIRAEGPSGLDWKAMKRKRDYTSETEATIQKVVKERKSEAKAG